jgi:hypothetical protein
MTQENILLDLDPLAAKSYNALQAAIAINAVDSERKDQARDFNLCRQLSTYLSILSPGLLVPSECEFLKFAHGHPTALTAFIKNAAYLKQTVDNISQYVCWGRLGFPIN